MNNDIYVLVEHLQGHVFEITYTLLAQARQVANAAGGKVVAVLLGSQATNLTTDFGADEILSYDHPVLAVFTAEAYQIVLAGLLAEKAPRLMLFGETSIGAETASGLSSRLKLPLASSCAKIEAGPGGLRYLSQTCGGKILVEGDLPEDTTVLIAMLPGAFKIEQGKGTGTAVTAMPAPDLSGLRTSVKQVIEPVSSDVDITKENMLVAVGRGFKQKDDLELAEELAGALGAVVAGTRPIVDLGWLPTSRLIGKSGKAVKPKLYLAFGISGAPEHVEGISASDTIIAVNTDPAAPIFSVAQYGAVVDALDLLPILTEQVQAAKGG